MCVIKSRRNSNKTLGAELLMKRDRTGGWWWVWKFKERHCHLPGFLGITILVAGSACQPWLTTPLGKEGGKGEENTLVSKVFKAYVIQIDLITPLWKHCNATAVLILLENIPWLRLCTFNLTFYCLFHGVSHKGSEVFCPDGSVRLGH